MSAEWVTHCPDVVGWRKRIVRQADSTQDTSVCWNWFGRVDSGGYGIFPYRVGQLDRTTSAHRAAYLAFVDDIGAALVVDHLCRNHACVNPRHLEPVTTAENNRRGDSGPLGGQRRQRCVNGHRLTAETIASMHGRRWCAACFPLRGRLRREFAVDYPRPEGTERLADMMRAIEHHRAS